jgi:hypothetical protein
MIFDSSVWQSTTSSSEFFEYQVGPIITKNPWGRPSYDKLKSILIDAYQNTMLGEYDVDIYGGVLFSWNETWDVDISIRNGLQDYELIESLMNYITDISLNKYSTLVDVKYNYHKFTEGKNYYEEGKPHLKYFYYRKQCGDRWHELYLDREDTIKVTKNLIKSGWRSQKESQATKLLNRLLKYGPNMVTTFDAKIFIEKDEEYFNSHTNRNLF